MTSCSFSLSTLSSCFIHKSPIFGKLGGARIASRRAFAWLEFLENRFSCHPKQPYEPKHTTTPQHISTLTQLQTMSLPSHTTPYWYVMPVVDIPRSVQLFSSRASPFRYRVSPYYLTCSILLYPDMLCLSLLCAVISCSISLCDDWHFSVPHVLLCASLCFSFRICAALCHSATPKASAIILINLSLIQKSRINTVKSGRPYPTIKTNTFAHHITPYYTPQLWHQNIGTA